MPCVCLVNQFKAESQGGTPTTLQVGSGSQNAERSPQDGLYDFSQASLLFNDGEISAMKGKQIEGISFFYQSWTTGYTLLDQTIRLAHIQENSFSTAVNANYSNYTITNMTTCLADFDQSVVNGWYRFNFTNNFTFNNGTLNLLVSLENRDGSFTSGYGSTTITATTLIGNTLARFFTDNSYPVNERSRSSNRMNVKFHYLA